MTVFSSRYYDILLGSSTGALIGILWGPVGSTVGSMPHRFTA